MNIIQSCKNCAKRKQCCCVPNSMNRSHKNCFVPTQFARITASPEALAHALADRELMCDHCINDVTNCKEDCYHGIINWLNSPAEEDKNEGE